MALLIAFVGLLQVAAGVVAFIVAKSAMYYVLAAIAFGMGVVSISLGIAVHHLAAIRNAIEGPV